MHRVALLSPTSAVAPEIPALARFLDAAEGFQSMLHETEASIDPAQTDVVYRMMGMAPRWVATRVPEVHDYASLSTGRLPRAKNHLKRIANRQPLLRSFLSPFVRDELGFTDHVPFIERDMGVPASFFEARRATWEAPASYEFDLIYVGSLSATRAVHQMVEHAVGADLTVLLVGEPAPGLVDRFRHTPLVQFAGQVPQHEIPAQCGRAWAGVSQVPDVYPLSRQTPTKILEYCALGMPVVTNSTTWARTYQRSSGASFLTVASWSGLSKSDVHGFGYRLPDVAVPSWDEVFAMADVLGALRRVLA